MNNDNLKALNSLFKKYLGPIVELEMLESELRAAYWLKPEKVKELEKEYKIKLDKYLQFRKDEGLD